MRAPPARARVGCDVLAVARLAEVLARAGSSFARELFTPAECLAARGDLVRLSRWFAVKEATIKVLGTGLASGMSPLLLEVSDLPPAARAGIPAGAVQHRVAWRSGVSARPQPLAVAAWSWCAEDHVHARACTTTGGAAP